MKTRKTIVIASIALFTLISVNAFAFMGSNMGNGSYNGHMGYGQNSNYMGNNGNHMWNNQNSDDQRIVSKQMDAFMNDTRGISQEIYNTRAELNRELSSVSIDKNKALKLQKKLSALTSEIEQKRVAQMLKLQKQFPDSFRGYGMNGRYMGYGSMHY